MMIMKKGMSLFHEAGQSLVEFALVTLFVILPVTFGIIDGSILFYKWVNLTNGAREGARAGAIYHYGGTEPSDGSRHMMEYVIDPARENVIIQAVEATVKPLVSIQDLEVTYYPEYPCITEGNWEFCNVYRSGDLVTVAITHTHTSIVGLVIGLGQIDVSATATMRIEPGGAAPTPTPSP